MTLKRMMLSEKKPILKGNILGSMRGPCDGTVLNLHCGGGYVNANTIENYTELNMYVYACKTSEI